MGAVAAGGLAVAAGPVPGEGEQKRGQAECSERGDVDDQSGDEPDDRAGDRAAEQ